MILYDKREKSRLSFIKNKIGFFKFVFNGKKIVLNLKKNRLEWSL